MEEAGRGGNFLSGVVIFKEQLHHPTQLLLPEHLS